MALTSGSVLSASEFIALKARVKAECARRKYVGSVASYAGTAYDYTASPADGGTILPEHVNKLITPMNKIVNTGLSVKSAGDVVPALNTLESLLKKSEGYSLTASSTNCNSSCTGLCYGGCANTCRGCGGNCSGSCSGSCTGGCQGTCTSTCANDCTTFCLGGASYNPY